MGIGSGELLTWLNTYTYPEETKFADPDYAAAIAQKFFDALWLKEQPLPLSIRPCTSERRISHSLLRKRKACEHSSERR
jgi:hypothetical protein